MMRYVLTILFALMIWVSLDDKHAPKLERYGLTVAYACMSVLSFLMAIEFEPLLRWVGRL